MSDEFKKQQKRYFHDIKKHLSGKPAARRYFRSLRANMERFIADNSVSDITALYTQFGTAVEIAEAYLEEISPVELSKHIRRLRIFRFVLLKVPFCRRTICNFLSSIWSKVARTAIGGCHKQPPFLV